MLILQPAPGATGVPCGSPEDCTLRNVALLGHHEAYRWLQMDGTWLVFNPF